MRTKTLLLTAALGIAGMASTMAQVYSVNAVGYVNTTVSPGFNLIANPLTAATNKLSSLLPATIDNFTQVFRWAGTDYDIATFAFGTWDKDFTLLPGEAFFINAASTRTLTFVGDVPQGNLTNTIPVGFSMKSSMVPQAGTVTQLGLTGFGNFDQIYKWGGSDFVIYTYAFGAWNKGGVPEEPAVGVGEGFFVNAGAQINWVRTFNVNQ